MARVTLTKLHAEGKLTIGDTLTHSETGETGEHEIVAIYEDKRISVKDTNGLYHIWTIDFGPGIRIV